MTARPDILPLIDEATLTVADGQFGTTSASLVATKRLVFVVPHSARVVPILMNYLPGARGQGALLVLAGLGTYALGLASVLVIPGLLVILAALVTPCIIGGGLYKLVKGKQVDERTQQATGAWKSGYSISLIVGIFVGVALIWPTMELGKIIYQSVHPPEKPPTIEPLQLEPRGSDAGPHKADKQPRDGPKKRRRRPANRK